MIFITDPEILAVSIVECHEPLIDLKIDQRVTYGPPPECEETRDDYTKLRKTVLEKLCQAQSDLPEGWKFRLFEGFRSIKVQQFIFDNEYARVVKRNPKMSERDLFRETTRLVSPVTNWNGSKNTPAHNTGGALDIEVVKADGQLLDMGMTAAECWTAGSSFCATDCDEISAAAQQNRRLLLEIMQGRGFVNYPTEWWHYSYGDRYWAYHRKAAAAIYGSADEL